MVAEIYWNRTNCLNRKVSRSLEHREKKSKESDVDRVCPVFFREGCALYENSLSLVTRNVFSTVGGGQFYKLLHGLEDIPRLSATFFSLIPYYQLTLKSQIQFPGYYEIRKEVTLVIGKEYPHCKHVHNICKWITLYSSPFTVWTVSISLTNIKVLAKLFLSL